MLAGISTDQPSTSFIPKAVREATLALDFATVADRVVLYSQLPIRRLLLHRAADYVQPALPAWAADLAEADAKSDGELVKTLRALADADMNVQQAARALDVHANTLYARIKRIREITGRDCQRYHDLTELLLAADCRTGCRLKASVRFIDNRSCPMRTAGRVSMPNLRWVRCAPGWCW